MSPKKSKRKSVSKAKHTKKTEQAPKPAKLKRSGSEVDFETLIKDEYTRLHRQYRLMESHRHEIAGATGRLSRQGRILSHLRDEKESITNDLVNATCKTYQQRDKDSIRTILHALERYEGYKLELAHCVADMAEMEANVDKITKRLIDQQLKVQAIFGRALTVSQTEHRTKVLENRLYHVTTLFDTLVTANNKLRDEINMMLKLRGQVFRRLMNIKRFSASIKSKMGGVVYEASQAYEQRDDWVNKTVLLRDKNDKDSKQHVLEIKEFQRVLHHDSKIHTFMSIKNVNRDVLENNQQRTLRKNTFKIEELNALLAAYKKSFKTILKMSIYRDVESLVMHYLEEEQKNYSVFKYVTDLNNEVNWLKQSIEDMKVSIEALNKVNQDTDVQKEAELQQLEEQLEKEKKEFLEIAQKWKTVDISMEGFGVVLDQTFSTATCATSAISAILGNSTGMRPSNICLCLAILERRVTELLRQKGELEVRKLVELEKGQLPKRMQYWQPGIKPKPSGGPFKPKLLITGRMDTEQDDDDEATKSVDTPFYYKDLKKILMEQVKERRLTLGGEEGGGLGAPSFMDVSYNPSTMDVKGSSTPDIGRKSVANKPVAHADKHPGTHTDATHQGTHPVNPAGTHTETHLGTHTETHPGTQTSAPQHPTIPPKEPTVPPKEPTVPPTEPTVPPKEPTIPPTEPTVPPIEPIVPPKEPTVPPTEPTVPPTEPTDPPKEPTDPPP